MPEALTYSSLVTDIQTYAERSDTPFTEQIPRLIMLAENRLASEVRGLGFVRVVNFNLTIGNATYEKPIRWRETKELTIVTPTGRKSIYPRSLPYCRKYWPNVASVDTPEFYADYDYEHYVVAPTPDVAYVAEMIYYERPEPLSNTNQTNWTTQYAPQLLLYASLLEAQPFLKMPERIAEFQALYDRAAQALRTEDISRIGDASANRSKA
jgi:hypothetical protein